MNSRTWAVSGLAAVLLLGGCGRAIQKQDPSDRPALALNDFPAPTPSQAQSINERAAVVITDERGFKVLRNLTPTVMSLMNDAEAQRKSYRISISMAGAPAHERALVAKRDGWYIRGSRVFAESIGSLVIDPQTGAMYTISAIDAGTVFAASVAQISGNLAAGTYVVLLSDVPAELKPKMTRVL